MKKQIKIAYFPSNSTKDKVLSTNGKSLDRYCTKCEVDEDISTGNYILDATFLIEDNLQDILQEEVIIKVLMDYGYEIFRISKVTVGTRYIDVVARQITIADSLTLWLEDVRPTNLNGQGAVTWMLDKAEGKKEIEIISDIETTATAYYQRMSLYKALHDNDNSFLKRWGGEVQRRGYTIYINKRIGIDRGVTIREGKNLTGFDSTSNIDNLVTRARGEGYNGILGNYIDSPLIDKYNRIYTSVIKYDDVKVKDENNTEGFNTEEEAIAELDRRINEEYSKNSIDKIKASYNINFVQLEKTEQYKNYISAEIVYIGDTIRVYIPRLRVNIKVRAMIKKYDVLAQKTKETKLSNYIEAKSISIMQIVDRLNNIDSTDTILQKAKDSANSLIKNGLKNSNVIVRENEIIIGDTNDINTMTKVFRWNNKGLEHSSTGYYGNYSTLINMDAKINSANNKTWINLDDGTFNLADIIKYDGNTATYDFGNTDVAKQSDIDNAKAEIRKDYQNAKVSINSANGIVAKEGAFTLTNSQGTIIIDGQSNIHKIIKEGTATIQYRGQSITVTVAHNLGYKPSFSAYQMGLDNANEYSTLPYSKWTNADGEIAQIRARADNNNLYFDFLAKTGSNISNLDIKIKYFIYKETVF